tara:strand:+ start:492 stop:734 length:243 start_codon:yes stop_codon:yes gene_type:complete
MNLVVVDSDDWTPLHHAAWKNSLEVAQLLIEKYAELEAKTKLARSTPMQRAARQNSLDVARLLIEHGASTDGIDLSWMND